MEDYLKHAIELVKAQASVRVMSEDEMTDMIASLAAKLKKFDAVEECEESCPCAVEAPVTDAKRSIKEKSIVCLLRGSFDISLFTSGMKPMSSILSASSRTKHST